MPPRWRDRRQAAGTHVSLALGPSASSFSLSIKARLRDSLCIERVQRYEAQLSWGGFSRGQHRAPCSYQERSSTWVLGNLPDSASPWMSRRQNSSKMDSNGKITNLTHIYYLPICPGTSENACVFTTCSAYKVSSHLISMDPLNNEAGMVTPTL